MTDTTLLILDGMNVPPYSARGLEQTLTPIRQAIRVVRTVNGDARDLSISAMRKYASTITGSDQQPPALDGQWPGMIVDVSCVKELAYETSTGGASRPVVAGSSRDEGEFTFYRPKLRMMIVDFEAKKNEYGAITSWTLQLEEV